MNLVYMLLSEILPGVGGTLSIWKSKILFRQGSFIYCSLNCISLPYLLHLFLSNSCYLCLPCLLSFHLWYPFLWVFLLHCVLLSPLALSDNQFDFHQELISLWSHLLMLNLEILCGTLKNISRCLFIISYLIKPSHYIFIKSLICFSINSASVSSVQFSHSIASDSLQPHGLQRARPPCPSPIPGACSNSCPSSRWCHPTISSSVVPSPPAFNLSQRQGLFKGVSSSHQVARVLEFQLQPQSFQWIFRVDCL